MILTATITEEHIKHGVAKDCSKCPVALCIVEMFNEKVRVHVGVSGASFAILPELLSSYVTSFPQPAVQFIWAFDKTTDPEHPERRLNPTNPEPFSFKFWVPNILIPYLKPEVTYTQHPTWDVAL